MKTNWVIINESKTAPLAASVTPEWLAACAVAFQIQLNRDVSAQYGGQYTVRAGATSTDIRPGEAVYALLDTVPAEGAIAYHDDNGTDVPVAFQALSLCNTLDDISSAISHELCESAGDDACNIFADDLNGFSFAFELSDAIELNGYRIGTIFVSDFLLPSFFEPKAPGPYTFCQASGLPGDFPTAALQTARGGYQIKRNQGTGEVQVEAHQDSKRGQIVLAGRHHPSSRPARRGVKRAV